MSKDMKVADAARMLKIRPQVIHALIRNGKLEVSEGDGPRTVNVDDVQALVSGETKRGRARTTGQTDEDLKSKHNVELGTILYTVVETRRKVRVVDRVRQETVRLKSAHDESKWAGISYLPGKISEDIEAGKITVEEDRQAILRALAQSYELTGDEEISKQLYAVLEQLTN